MINTNVLKLSTAKAFTRQISSMHFISVAAVSVELLGENVKTNSSTSEA